MGVIKKGENWFIDYYFQGRRIREKIGTSKPLAELALKKRKVEIAEKKFLDVRKIPRVKFDKLAESYLELYSRPNKKSSRRDELSIKHLSKSFGGRNLCEITSFDVEKYKQKRKEKGLRPATVNRELACLKHMFTKAVEWKMAETNPAAGVKLYREDNKRIRYLSEKEIKELLAASPPHLKAVLITALNTGMRRGELFGLKWQDVDLEQGVLRVRMSKSGEGREIPINRAVGETLKGLSKHPGSDYVFCKGDGSAYWDLKKSFKRACRDAGIQDFRFHDLRHTFASHLVMKGADLKTVQELLGHKTYAMTLRYAHLSPSYKSRIIDRISLGMDTLWTPKSFLEEAREEYAVVSADNTSI